MLENCIADCTISLSYFCSYFIRNCTIYILSLAIPADQSAIINKHWLFGYEWQILIKTSQASDFLYYFNYVNSVFNK